MKAIFACRCCSIVAAMSERREDVDMGAVCPDCKVQLRAASAWLKHGGLRVCSHVAEAHELRPLDTEDAA